MGVETAMMAATVGAGIMGGVGKLQEGKSAEASAYSRANAMDAGAAAQERKAAEERALASRRAEDQEAEAKRLMSRQRAVAAASGGGTGGSAALIEAETAGEGKYKADLDLWAGEEKGKGLEFQAQLDRASAEDTRRQGKQVRKASYLAAGSTILGSVGAAYKGSGPKGGGASKGMYY